jgi:hypothetical protein
LVATCFFVIYPRMKKVLLFLLALWPLAAPGARAESDCLSPASIEAPTDGPLQPLHRVEAYHAILKSCTAGSRERLAIRTMRVAGEEFLLTVDPQSLDASLERAACWTCREAQGTNRFLQSVERAAAEPGKSLKVGASWLDNAGLKHGRGAGAFLTADLCPSRRKLDRDFLQKLEKPGEATPIALSVSGLWILHHPDDFAWLRKEKRKGRLAIAFVNHSYSHPYRPGLPEGENFLLMPGVDKDSEVFDVERLLIANGETPSVFFRFPGLISDAGWMEALRRDHLIALGADAWLALEQKPRSGSILLVHANGNEPLGLGKFESLSRQGALPTPFLPLTEAP